MMKRKELEGRDKEKYDRLEQNLRELHGTGYSSPECIKRIVHEASK